MSQISATPRALELWGGVECTVNRVGDSYFDQLERSGHDRRIEDLDRFAALGITAIRYPVLWERTAPDGLERADWSWPDARLARLKELEVRPIVGLVHHGSGPRHTSLIDPLFAEGLAAYAGAVAARYPWVTDYTPVNEPLTTARFSGLYGHWYPHGRDDTTFVRALLNQCRAVILAMRAIRAVNPAARLVQTDDLGKIYSTPKLAYQAAFENDRRWLTFDLLCGRVDRQSPMWGYLRDSGVGVEELEWFLANSCPPDIIGINTYVVSERFLDERLDRYPPEFHGGNRYEAYADVAAVHVLEEGIGGLGRLLPEAWERYQLPLAVTEAHCGSLRDEQLRWLLDCWDACVRLRTEGVDIRAVTAWALLGSHDWASLVTRQSEQYEPGLFDVSAPTPRPTALAHLAADLAAGREPEHPALATPGWWRRPTRFFFGRFDQPDEEEGAGRPDPALAGWIRRGTPQPILITGANGTLGRALAWSCERRGQPHVSLARSELDIADLEAVAAALDSLRPWAVVNAAGYVRVDDAEREPERCFRENTQGAAVLAAMCARRGIRLLTISSDLVFDGAQRTPYVESDPVAPLNVYGRSKAAAEREVLSALPTALVVRASAFFGPWDAYNFVTLALGALARGEPFVAADDLTISPTYVPDLVDACLDLLTDGEEGTWHLANIGALTWADLARRVADMAGYSYDGVVSRPAAQLDLVAPRPAYSALGSERGLLLPSLDDALGRYAAAIDLAPLLERAVG